MGPETRSGRLAAWGIATAALVVPLTTMVSHSFSRVTYPLVLPAIKDDLNLTNSDAGFAGTSVFFAYLLGVIIVTLAAGRINPATVMKIGLAISVVGLGLIAIGPTFPYLILGLVVANLATASIWITAPVLATRDVAPHRRGLVIGMLTGSMGLANTVVAFGTRQSRAATGNDNLWRPVFGAEVVFAIVVLALVLLTIHKRATPPRSGRNISLAALKTMPGWLPLTLAYTMFGIITSGFSAFLAEALEEDGGITRSSVATIYLILGLTGFASAISMGWLSDRIGRRTALIVVAITSAAASIAVAVLSDAPLIAMVILFGSMWSAFPSLTATYVRDHLDDQAFGSAFGVMTIFYAIAAVAPPWLAGVIADDRGSFTVPYVGLAVISLAAAGILSRLPSFADDVPR